MRKLVVILGAATALAAASAPAAQGAARDLDHTFGDDGIVLTPIPDSAVHLSGIATQPDGKVVAVGSGRDTFYFRYATVLARYLPNGELDPNFGDHGLAVHAWSDGGTTGEAVGIQPDGKIVVSGRSEGSAGQEPFVARYLPNGTVDSDFGDGGRRVLPLDEDYVSAPGLALQDDGRIVVAGEVAGPPQGNGSLSDLYVTRLTASGEIDASFGTGGVTVLQHESTIVDDLVLQDGRPVVVGSIWVPDEETYDAMLVRLDANGQLDDTFGDGGIVRDRGGNDDFYFATGAAVWNGKLVVSGYRTPSSSTRAHNYMVARYNADGSDDETFNPGAVEPGHVFAGAGDSDPRANAIAVDPATGAATLTGSATVDSKTELMVVRYTSSGARDDAGFVSEDGHVGARLLDVGDGGDTIGWDVLLDARGRTLVAGQAMDGGTLNGVLARLGHTPSPPPPNRRPIARIRGHRLVPRKHWVRFDALRSFDRDGRIVDYAWRTGKRPFRSLGPIFWHRFGRTGVHRLELRVTDDHGARSYAKLYVSVRRRGRS